MEKAVYNFNELMKMMNKMRINKNLYYRIDKDTISGMDEFMTMAIAGRLPPISGSISNLIINSEVLDILKKIDTEILEIEKTNEKIIFSGDDFIYETYDIEEIEMPFRLSDNNMIEIENTKIIEIESDIIEPFKIPITSDVIFETDGSHLKIIFGDEINKLIKKVPFKTKKEMSVKIDYEKLKFIEKEREDIELGIFDGGIIVRTQNPDCIFLILGKS